MNCLTRHCISILDTAEDMSPESVGLYDEHRMMVQIPRDQIEAESLDSEGKAVRS